MMANGWTDERRKRQAKLIQRWRPWENSAGPGTLDGKAKASRHAHKGAERELLRELQRALKALQGALEPLLL